MKVISFLPRPPFYLQLPKLAKKRVQFLLVISMAAAERKYGQPRLFPTCWLAIGVNSLSSGGRSLCRRQSANRGNEFAAA